MKEKIRYAFACVYGVITLSFYVLSAMEPIKPQAFSNILPIGKMYYEFHHIESEVLLLKVAMEKIYLQHDLLTHSYSMSKNIDDPSIVTFYYNLNATKKIDSTIFNLIESQITLHAPYYAGNNNFDLIQEKLNKLYTICDEIIENRIRFLKSTNQTQYHTAYLELLTAFNNTQYELKNYIIQNNQYWLNHQVYNSVDSLVKHFDHESLAQIIKNKFAYEVISAAEDQKIIDHKKELLKLFFQENTLLTTQQALVERFAILYSTPNGKQSKPNTGKTFLESSLAKKAFKKKYHHSIRILILEYCPITWFSDHRQAIKNTLKEIRTEVLENEYDIDQLIQPQGKPGLKITQTLSAVAALYSKLARASNN